MKNLISIVLICLAARTYSQFSTTNPDKRLHDKYKKSADAFYSEKKYNKAIAQYRFALQLCYSKCDSLKRYMDSCLYFQKNNIKK
jgi:hypothetical protein